MKSPVLFIIFKRKETTKRVFDRIREVRPPRLYIAADGPRADRAGELERCKETRLIVENIDWPCEVHRLYRDMNLGCGKGVSSAISWFFEHEEQGIIIEDDILAHVDFFNYCDELLELYKNDERIQLISGNNCFYDGYNSKDSYYLSSYMSIWGWASWKRVWKTYDFDVNHLDEERLIKRLFDRLPQESANYFMNIYIQMKDFKIDTWDYQLFLNQQYYNRYAILPYINMIENIGINSDDATHTKSADEKIINHKAKTPYPIKHPSVLSINPDADYVVMKNGGIYIKSFFERLIHAMNNIFYLIRYFFLGKQS